LELFVKLLQWWYSKSNVPGVQPVEWTLPVTYGKWLSVKYTMGCLLIADDSKIYHFVKNSDLVHLYEFQILIIPLTVYTY